MSLRRNASIWVVEMEFRKFWFPTVGIAYSRTSGRNVLISWRTRNPDDKFRLRQFKRAKP